MFLHRRGTAAPLPLFAHLRTLQGGYPQASNYPTPGSNAYSAPGRGYQLPSAYGGGAAPTPSYGGLGGGWRASAVPASRGQGMHVRSHPTMMPAAQPCQISPRSAPHPCPLMRDCHAAHKLCRGHPKLGGSYHGELWGEGKSIAGRAAPEFLRSAAWHALRAPGPPALCCPIPTPPPRGCLSWGVCAARGRRGDTARKGLGALTSDSLDAIHSWAGSLCLSCG